MTTSRCVLLCTLIAIGACTHTVSITAFPRAGELRGEPLEEELQRKVALHEAAHALAQVSAFGFRSLKAIHVHTVSCPEDEPDCCPATNRAHHGTINPTDPTWFDPISEVRLQLVVYLVGVAAEARLNASDDRGGIDEDLAMDKANEIAVRLQNTQVFLGHRRYIAPAKLTVQAAREYRIGMRKAERFVRENEDLIRLLAEDIMLQQPAYGSRVMSGYAVERFLGSREVITPIKSK